MLRDILRAMDRPGDDFDWVRDRPDHDRRCASTPPSCGGSLARELTNVDFAMGLEATIEWYCRDEAWWRPAKDATEALCRAGTVGVRRLNRRG